AQAPRTSDVGEPRRARRRHDALRGFRRPRARAARADASAVLPARVALAESEHSLDSLHPRHEAIVRGLSQHGRGRSEPRAAGGIAARVDRGPGIVPNNASAAGRQDLGYPSNMGSLDVGLDLAPGQDVELLVADLSLARAFFEGVPAARLLARVRLALDARDLSAPPGERGSYDALIGRMLGNVRPALDRVRKAVVRHTRAASDEGPLPATETIFADLACTVALSPDIDASISEALGEKTGRVSMADLGEIGAFT